MDEHLEIHSVSENAQQAWLGSAPERSPISTGLLSGVLDGIDYGVIAVRGLGKILFANQAARTELETASHIRSRNDRLTACSPRTTLAIERAILDARNGSRQLVEITAGRTTLTLSFAPVYETPGDLYSTRDSITRPVLVLIGRREVPNAASLTEFARIHGISNAEKRLLPAICTGASIKEMAGQHEVSACTVRVHLKNIRRKTGTSSLRTLMLQLVALPPVMSLFEM